MKDSQSITDIHRPLTDKPVGQRIKQCDMESTLKFFFPNIDTWQQNLKPLGHILRATRENPLRQVLLEYGSSILRIFHIKRCGRPKLD